MNHYSELIDSMSPSALIHNHTFELLALRIAEVVAMYCYPALNEFWHYQDFGQLKYSQK